MGFWSRLKKELWRVIRAILFVIIITSVIITIITYGKKIKRPEIISMIIDSDSGNEIDDLFAITYALINPQFDIVGLTSAQWNMHPNAGDSSVYVSQKINEDLLALHERLDIPHPLGANDQTGYWGDTKPIPSAASQFIIDEAHKMPYGKKINVLTLGAVTNLASAIMLDTTIIPKIAWYAMALRYDDRTGVWDKNEFNVRNDLDGMDYLLNREGLETHIMTATTSRIYTYEKTETLDLMEHRGPKWDYLTDRWKTFAPKNKTWIMWDVALMHAIGSPDLVTEKEVSAPDENLSGKVFVYTWIDAKKMKSEYWKMVRLAMGDMSR